MNRLIFFVTSTFLQIFILTLIFTSSVHANQNWLKSTQNPVLVGRGSDFWDGSSILSPTVLKRNSQYQMWFVGNNGLGWTIGYAISPNGISDWTLSSTPVISVGSSDGWEKEIINPSVIYDSSSSQYKMWYTSSNTDHWISGFDRFRTRYATSTDGVTWNTNAGWVLYGSAGKWDEGGTNRGISVIKLNNTYHMWYAGTNTNDLGDNPFWRIGYATSTDGIHWTKQNNGNPVITPNETWELNNVSYPAVIYENGLFKMWYGAGIGDQPTQIDYAYSTDGINWIKPLSGNPSLTTSTSDFDSQFINPNTIMNEGNQYKLWNSGYDGNHWSIGYATMDALSNLTVPLLKQTDPVWGTQIYDGANNWDPLHKTIGDWGCAMTSAAMILQYHGINKLPDGTSLNPGTLNTWLKNQSDGYIDGISSGYMNPLAITRLAKNAVAVNNITAFDALEYQHLSGENKTQLTSDLNNSQPDMLEVPGHFIVATGVNGNTFAINDPYYNRTDLTNGYNNTFLSLNRYIPSHTDLSYIMLAVNPTITVTIKDSNGNIVGNQFTQQPYADPLNNNATHGNPLKMVFVPKPATGTYQITISANTTQTYQLHSYLYDQQGNVHTDTSKGTISQNIPDILTINFNKQNSKSSLANRIITFQSFIDDINENVKLQQINKSISNALIPLIRSAKESVDKKQKMAAKLKLDAIEIMLKVFSKKGISDSAFQILLYDETYLKAHL